MAIPEHDKCVAYHKRNREFKHKGGWKIIRQFRRKQGKQKHKARIKQMIDARFMLVKAAIKKVNGVSYTDFMKASIGKHYKKWGKYK